MAEAVRKPESGRSFSMDVDIAGATLRLSTRGVAYWPDTDILIVADLHLEKGSSHATRGVFLPPYDTGLTLQALQAAIDEFAPSCVISLGDSFHDRSASERLPETYRLDLKAMTRAVDWIWVSGNHDPQPPEDCGGTFVEELAIGPLVFRHEPTRGSQGEVAGHLHPSARIRRRGRSIRRRCFGTDGNRLILPAFGSLTGGLNVLDPAYGGLFDGRNFQAYMLGKDRVYPMRGSQLRADPQ